MSNASEKIYGLLAEFKSSGELLHAAEKMRDAGYEQFDCHSPFPIHGMDAAMGLKRSPVGYIAGVCGLIGLIFGFALQIWVSVYAYPLVIAGKPFNSYQAWIVVAFGLMVLFAAFGALFGMLLVNHLPQWHHELFNSENFSTKASNDGFFVSVVATDRKFDIAGTRSLLELAGGTNIEEVAK